MNIIEALTKLRDGVEEALGDLTTLDVVTFTGNINIMSNIVEEEGDKPKIKLKKLYQNIASEAVKVESALRVVAFTHVDFDCDSVNFVKTDMTEAEAKLLDAHNAMVNTAQETRQGVITMITEAIGIS
jgi:hypothetical protein